MHRRLTAFLASLAAVLLGSIAVAPAQADPATPVTGTVQIWTDSFLVGGTWTSTTVTDPIDATRVYQWLRDGQPIPGANVHFYTATTADLGASLSLRVVVSRVDRLPATLTSEAYGPVLTEYPAPVPVSTTPGDSDGDGDVDDEDELDTFDAYRPLVVGKVRVGSTVRVETDEDDYDEDTTLVYQWLVDGQPARMGSGTTFKLKKKHRGKVVTVQVTASAPGYESETVTSRPKKVRR